MTQPALVLVHGAQHAGDCWDPTIAQLRELAPDLRVLAVDLPGRRGKSGNLVTARIDDWVDSIVADIDDTGLDEIVIVGHSMAGLTVPGVVAKLGSIRVQGKPATMPTAWAMFTFCNGMTLAQRRFVRDRFYPESPTVVLENVDRRGMPADVARTWILTRRDRTFSVKAQRRCIEALGGVQTLIELDTCHDLMVSEPRRLAEILAERSRLYG